MKIELIKYIFVDLLSRRNLRIRLGVVFLYLGKEKARVQKLHLGRSMMNYGTVRTLKFKGVLILI
jgi:hypothetical protein